MNNFFDFLLLLLFFSIFVGTLWDLNNGYQFRQKFLVAQSRNILVYAQICSPKVFPAFFDLKNQLELRKVAQKSRNEFLDVQNLNITSLGRAKLRQTYFRPSDFLCMAFLFLSFIQASFFGQFFSFRTCVCKNLKI